MNRLLRTLMIMLGAFAALLMMPGIASADDDKVKVLSQNLYVGSDLFQILDDTKPVPLVAAQIFSDVQMTDFFSRVEVIADLIAKRRPHLVGLQEVSLIRTECPSSIMLTGNATPNALDVFADYKQLLLDALEARGLDYEVIASIEDVDVELPAVNAPGLLPGCGADFIDVRLTDFDITLKRGDVEATMIMQKRFEANLPVDTPAGPVTFYRGFTVVDAEVNGRVVRFANTHLEVDGNPYANFFQYVQAYELTQTLNALALSPWGDKPLIVAGDFNSSPDKFYADCFLPDPVNGVVENGCLSAYGLMATNGYADTWELRDDDEFEPGFTCCQAPLLDNKKSELDRRIDQVWYRGPLTSGGGLEQMDEVNVKVTGAKKKDKTVNDLWSSDHAGVFAVLKFEEDEDDGDDDRDH
jgi:hypothetical protein